MTEKPLPEEVTKESFRQKVWDYITKNDLGNFPLGVYHRIPNFKGAANAAQCLSKLEEFKNAKVIKINPDKPQQPVRYLALEANKEILVPIPRLTSGLFLHVTPIAGAPKEKLKAISEIRGMLQVGKPLGIDSNIKVDLVVLGSVCVSSDGYRLGKGEGYADLEFALMMRMGAVTQDTTIVTTVHDCQIVDKLPPQLFKEYDVPVDIIVTPTQTIYVNPRLAKPTGILWHMLTQKKLNAMPVLQQLKEMDEKDGKIIVLKEADTDTAHSTDGAAESADKTTKTKSRSARKRYLRKPKPLMNNNSPPDETKKKEENEKKEATPRSRRKKRSKSDPKVEFSLKLSNISGARVCDLKTALQERGVKPSKIIWQGHRDICYLCFNKLKNDNNSVEEPIQVDSIMAKLQQLCIRKGTDSQDNFVYVEPANPISRIEVTDVTSV